MRVLRRCIVAAVAAAACGLLPPTVAAGSFGISPLRVELSPAVPTGVLTVRNDGPQPVVVQARPMLWQQAAGQDELSETRELLVSPAVFTIEPGGSQLLRVALRREPDPRRELSYRLLLEEVPQQVAPDFNGLTVALRLSLPVFVAPPVDSRAELAWSAARTAAGALAVTARNDGNAHLQIRSFTLGEAGAAQPAARQVVASYLLPGQTRTWTFARAPGAAGFPARLRLLGESDRGAIEAELTTGGG